MSHLSFAKALHSKWTLLKPENGEKHFFVTRIADQKRREVKLECVVTKTTKIISFSELTSGEKYRPGWH